jgi:hypothetical protein
MADEAPEVKLPQIKLTIGGFKVYSKGVGIVTPPKTDPQQKDED